VGRQGNLDQAAVDGMSAPKPAQRYPNEIRRYRLEASLTLEQLAERVNLSISQVSRIERGERQPTLADLRLFSKVLKKPISALVASAPVMVVGFVGAGGEGVLYAEGQGPHEVVERPSDASDDTVAVVVKGDSMTGTADDGWTLYYDEVRTPPLDDLLGLLCVVGLDDGRILVKRLQRGRRRGRFDLYSNNTKPLLDQEVEWAAKVTWIKPR